MMELEVLLMVVAFALGAFPYLSRKYRSQRRRRLVPRNRYTVCSVNGDDGNDDIALDAPLATIREALKRERLSDIDGAGIVLLDGHVEMIGDKPLVIDSDSIHMVGSSSCNPKIVFDKPTSAIEIKGAYSYFAGIAFHGVGDVENKGIIVDSGKLMATFTDCLFSGVGAVYKAW